MRPINTILAAARFAMGARQPPTKPLALWAENTGKSWKRTNVAIAMGGMSDIETNCED